MQDNKRKRLSDCNVCKIQNKSDFLFAGVLFVLVVMEKKGKKRHTRGLRDFSPHPPGAAASPCGGIASAGLAEWEFCEVFANALLQFWSRRGEPWAKLGLPEWCLRGTLRGADNPFSLSSHRWVCSAAAPREITGLLSTYKIHLWNGRVPGQTCHSCSLFFSACVCVGVCALCVRTCVCWTQRLYFIFFFEGQKRK